MKVKFLTAAVLLSASGAVFSQTDMHINGVYRSSPDSCQAQNEQIKSYSSLLSEANNRLTIFDAQIKVLQAQLQATKDSEASSNSKK